ncbi:MAG: glycosyltransferase [Dysgonomonas sp.]
MDNNNSVTVSIPMITYNHESFIAQAIEGIVMQKTSFRIELVIGEDCSTDRTREICVEYQKKYPDIIRLNLQKQNVGAEQNFHTTYFMCTGKYIAMCEGDDYWTDPDKLQKQVSFLEQNPDFVMSTHNSAILGHNKKLFYNPPLNQTILTTEDIIRNGWIVMTASIVFKRDAFSYPEWFDSIENNDYVLQMLLSTKGSVNYIPEYMSVYRRHAGGVTAHFTPFYSAKAMYKLFECFDKETNGRFHRCIKEKIKDDFRTYRLTAKKNNLRRQYIGLSILYYSSKVGINAFPLVSRFSYFSK